MFRTDAGGENLASHSDEPWSSDALEHKAWALVTKRCFDLVGASLLLLIFLPVLTLIAICVAIGSGWPVIYSHNRMGRSGRLFAVYKFRSMRKDADRVITEFLDSNPVARSEWQAYQKLRNDPRVTAFGRFLRASSLDELPQLWNVVKGDMSLVGPRPVTAKEEGRYGALWTTYCSMRPGITGLWQVNGRNALTYEQRVAFDVLYVRSWSLPLDARILLKTVLVVLRGSGSM